MRTTLTLDNDVAAMLERLRKAREQSLKDLINEALRRGLKQMDARPSAGRSSARIPLTSAIAGLAASTTWPRHFTHPA